jgi:hypothetical protein
MQDDGMDKDLRPGQPRFLAVNHEMVVPVNEEVHLPIKLNEIGAQRI